MAESLRERAQAALKHRQAQEQKRIAGELDDRLCRLLRVQPHDITLDQHTTPAGEITTFARIEDYQLVLCPFEPDADDLEPALSLLRICTCGGVIVAGEIRDEADLAEVSHLALFLGDECPHTDDDEETMLPNPLFLGKAQITGMDRNSLTLSVEVSGDELAELLQVHAGGQFLYGLWPAE